MRLHPTLWRWSFEIQILASATDGTTIEAEETEEEDAVDEKWSCTSKTSTCCLNMAEINSFHSRFPIFASRLWTDRVTGILKGAGWTRDVGGRDEIDAE